MISLMKSLLGLTTGFVSYLFLATPAFAQAVNLCPENSNNFNLLCQLKFDNIGVLIGKLITIILIVAIIVSLFFLIYGGIKWVLSGGDKTAVEGARNHIVAAIVGLVIALLAFFIVNFVGGLFGISLTNLTIPKLTP